MLSFARVRAIVIVTVLVAAAVVLVVMALSKDQPVQVREVCPAGFVEANLSLPEVDEVKINVYNATDSVGLASDLAADFANRQFDVVDFGNDPLGSAVDGVAVLRYGPQAVGAAHLLRAYFLDQAVTEFDIDREDDVVDVVIGASFQQLATPTEVRQSIAAIGRPTLPEGTCEAQT